MASALKGFHQVAGNANDVVAVLGFLGGVACVFGVGYKVAQFFGRTTGLDNWRLRVWRGFLRRFDRRDAILALWDEVGLEVAALVEGHVDIYGLKFGPTPKPVPADAEDVQKHLPHLRSDVVKKAACKLRAAGYFPPHGENLSHALVVGEVADHLNGPCSRDNIEVPVVRTDYATIEALRRLKLPGTIVSAGALIYCRETDQIVLQLRTNHSATHPGCFHTFGGNYEPHTDVNRRDDGATEPFRRAALREIEEESGLQIRDTKRAPFLISRQMPSDAVSTDFIQYYYLGLYISKAQLDAAIGPHEEGHIQPFTIDELAHFIKRGRYVGPDGHEHQGNFVPAALVHILIWLGLGAPDENLARPVRTKALNAYRTIMSDAPSFLKFNAEALRTLHKESFLHDAPRASEQP